MLEETPTIFITAILTVIVLFLVKILLSQRRYFTLLSKIPGPPGVPLLGNIFQLNGSKEKVLRTLNKWGEEYGTPFRLWIGFSGYVILSKPSDIQIFLNHPSSAHKQTNSQNVIKSIYGDGLLISHPLKWKTRRQQIKSALTKEIIDSYISIFVKNSDNLVEALELKVDKPKFDIGSYMRKSALDTIGKTVVGIELSSQSWESEYLSVIMESLKLTAERIFPYWFQSYLLFELNSKGKQLRKYRKSIDDFTERVITNVKTIHAERAYRRFSCAESLSEISAEPKVRKAFVEYLIDFNKFENIFTQRDLQDEITTIFFKGFETIATTNSFVLLLLAIHVNIQQKVFAELDEIFGKSDREVTSEDIPKMTYLEMVIKEVLRLYPTIPFIIRQPDVEIELDEFTIPANTSVCINAFQLHRDESIWKNANVFDPMRFSPQEVNRHPFSYIPFAAGSRNCVGMKYAIAFMKVQLSRVLRSFGLTTDITENDIRLDFSMILRSKTGYPIRLHSR